MVGNVDDRHTRHFANPAFQVLNIGSDDEASMLLDAINNAVISISALVGALQSTESRVLSELEGQAEPVAHLFQLSNDAIADTRSGFRKQAVHQAFKDVQLVLDTKVDEIRVQKNVVGWSQRAIVFKEHADFLLFQLLQFDFVQFRYFLLIVLFYYLRRRLTKKYNYSDKSLAYIL